MNEGELDQALLSNTLNTMVGSTPLFSILADLSSDHFSLYMVDFILMIRNTSALTERMCILLSK